MGETMTLGKRLMILNIFKKQSENVFLSGAGPKQKRTNTDKLKGSSTKKAKWPKSKAKLIVLVVDPFNVYIVYGPNIACTNWYWANISGPTNPTEQWPPHTRHDICQISEKESQL